MFHPGWEQRPVRCHTIHRDIPCSAPVLEPYILRTTIDFRKRRSGFETIAGTRESAQRR